MKLKLGSLKTQYRETFSQTHQEKRERAQINKIRNERRKLPLTPQKYPGP